jgi:hypothetical protein
MLGEYHAVRIVHLKSGCHQERYRRWRDPVHKSLRYGRRFSYDSGHCNKIIVLEITADKNWRTVRLHLTILRGQGFAVWHLNRLYCTLSWCASAELYRA